MAVKTRFFITADTHGRIFDVKPTFKADVAIHCGDLTGRSVLEELRKTIDMMRKIDAPLKLVIAGNHELLLDDNFEELKAKSMRASRNPAKVDRDIGPAGAGRNLLDEAQKDGIFYLDEGNHTITLQNGALLRVYASPWTPAKWSGRAFQYPPEIKHEFAINNDVDVVISHGPPLGVFDATSDFGRAGDPNLFGAVAHTRPLLHCFGHIHSGWGAKLATWQPFRSQCQSHYTDIDGDKTVMIEALCNITSDSRDDAETAKAKAEKRRKYYGQGFVQTSHCSGDANPIIPGEQTLFLNAAYEWSRTGKAGGIGEQPPWIIDIELPQAR
ncbi:hypothetical protein PG995_012688 [Apiospora arundinis]